MRLIDADAFEKFIEEKYKDGESTDDIKDQMLFDLSYQPTAYDVEKVVEQAHQVFIDELNIVLKDIPEGTPYTKEAHRVLSLNKKVNNAIRNGGKE